MRVLFWGTPDFGLPSLDAMRGAGHAIVGVVTNPDRPAGRGRKLRPSPVKRWAVARDVPVLQPDRPRGAEFVRAVRSLSPDISVVAAYGQLLSQEILDLPELGSINVHASLLPELRGAAPINWAIIRGHARSGVTIMRMVLELDAGPMLAQRATPIGPLTTAGALYRELAELGGPLLAGALRDLGEGGVVEREQDHGRATYAPKLDRDAARIDWSREAGETDRWIRGCDPWPAAWTELGDETVQCFAPEVVPEVGVDASPGAIVEADPTRGLLVATGAGALRIGEVKPAGRRRMSAAAWVRGRAGLQGARFS